MVTKCTGKPLTGAFSGWSLGQYHITRRRRKNRRMLHHTLYHNFQGRIDFNTVNIHRILGFTSPATLISIRLCPQKISRSSVPPYDCVRGNYHTHRKSHCITVFRGWAGKKPSICAKTRYPAFVFWLLVIPAYQLEFVGKLAGRFFLCILLRKWKLLPENN